MLAAPTHSTEWEMRLEPVYRLFAAMTRGLDPELALGGKLLYAGELHEHGCQLVRAANIAGAASLSATADATALRHANRDGVTDFLVTSLDEALRILKNEIRKRQAVSVAVSVKPETMVAEMKERGVLPDLLPPAEWQDSSADMGYFLDHAAERLVTRSSTEDLKFRAWAPAPPGIDAAANAALAADDHQNRRWLHLSPRYLGPSARRVRSLACSTATAVRIEEILAAQANS